MKTKPIVRLVPRSDDGGGIYAVRNEELRRENSCLKTLVVQLSAIIAKDVAAQK
jgi:hypothetical protein